MRCVFLLAACSCLWGCFTAEVMENRCGAAGECVVDVGGGWVPVLVASAAKEPPPCPSAAPFASLTSTVPPLTACGVHESDTCGQGEVCVPMVEGWTACIVRDGAHECPSSYEPVSMNVPHESLCCPGD